PIDKHIEGLLTAEEICLKVNGYERGLVPKDATNLTAFIDVQGSLLYWAVVAWGPGFTGYVVDYGAWPRQQSPYYSLADAAPTLDALYKGGSEAKIHAALGELTTFLMAKEWPIDAGGVMKIGRCMVDANWGPMRDAVYAFCRQSPFAANIMPSHGRGI